MTRDPAGNRYWPDDLDADELAALDRGVADDLERRPDVLVVGGGILGAAVAAACDSAGLGSVVLIEAGRLGGGATGGAAGLLIPEVHYNVDPAPVVALGRSSLDRWRQADAAIPGGVGVRNLDWIALAPQPDSLLAGLPPAVRWLDHGEVAAAIPDLAVETSAAILTGQARVNPLRALLGLISGLRHVATGVAATAATVAHGRVTEVMTTHGVLAPGTVVFATGGPPDIAGIETSGPSDTVKGHLLVTEPAPILLPGGLPPLTVQLGDRRLLAGGTLDVGDSSPGLRQEVIDAVLEELVVAFPRLRGIRVTHRWCCWRPHHPDSMPVIDRLPSLDNGWLTSGHYRTGILMAPATGAILAEWVATGRAPAAAAPFTASRFG